MPIRINLDVMMAKRKIGLTELSDKVGISLANLSILKNNRARAVRFSTLDAICRVLDCQPGDLLEHLPEPADDAPGRTNRTETAGAAEKAVPLSCSAPGLQQPDRPVDNQ